MWSIIMLISDPKVEALFHDASQLPHELEREKNPQSHYFWKYMQVYNKS